MESIEAPHANGLGRVEKKKRQTKSDEPLVRFQMLPASSLDGHLKKWTLIS